MVVGVWGNSRLTRIVVRETLSRNCTFGQTWRQNLPKGLMDTLGEVW